MCLFVGFFIVVITITTLTSTDAVLTNTESSVILFPDDAKLAPKCSRNSTYCTQTNDYPTEYLNSLFERGIIANNGLLGVDHIVVENITQRIDINDEIPLCGSRERVIYPVQGETENGDWFFIANTDKIKQGVRVDECIRKDGVCSLINGIKTKCVQKYVYRQMIALNGGIVQEMKFKIPSCCMCMVMSTTKPKPQKRHRKRDAPIDYTDIQDDRIVFPETPPPMHPRSFPIPSTKLLPPPPSCAKGTTFCTSVTNYPFRHLQKLVASNRLKKIAIFGEIDPPVEETIATRFNQNLGVSLCDARLEKVFPVVAKSKENTWEYIVQYGDDSQELTQAVHLEICHKPESTCKFNDNFPNGYRTQCVQKYIYRQLLAISHVTGEPYLSHFQLPSCCVCEVASEPFGFRRKRRRK